MPGVAASRMGCKVSVIRFCSTNTSLHGSVKLKGTSIVAETMASRQAGKTALSPPKGWTLVPTPMKMPAKFAMEREVSEKLDLEQIN